MPRSKSLILDTRDDRREIHQLLESITPADRLAWLQWCCNQVKGPHGDKIKVRRTTTGENAMELFLDFWQLVVQYEFDPTPAAERLEEIARRSPGFVRHRWDGAGVPTIA